MQAQRDVQKSLPSYLKTLVPTAEQIHRALGHQQDTYSVDTTFIRAVDNPAFVGSASPYVSHRFGPPIPAFRNEDGMLEFNWVYLGLSPNVAAWESQFVKNNRGAGNGFHVTRMAEANGLFAKVRFARSLKLWSLSKDNASRLGVHDIISSEDHEACQWLGCRIRDAMLMLDAMDRPDGFVYPARRVKGAPALALADWSAPDLFATADVSFERFIDSETYAAFFCDSMRTEPPALDAPTP